MICLIALFVFAALGIFSAKYRDYFREALNCIFRRATLRKCDTGFDKKMKAKIVGRLMKRNPKIAAGVFRHFEAISWFFTILLFASMAYSVDGLYNYAVYGNCNGETSNAFCVFNLAGGDKATLSLSDIPLDEFPSFGPDDAKVQIVEFGCHQCPYTKAAETEMKKIRETYPDDVRITFVYAPTPHHDHATRIAEAAAHANIEGKYWEYHDLLFENQNVLDNSVSTEQAATKLALLAQEAGIEEDMFENCPSEEITADIVKRSNEYAVKLGITKTPTFYLNGELLSNAITLEDVTNAIEDENKTLKQKITGLCVDVKSKLSSLGVDTGQACASE